MASRYFFQFQQSLERKVVSLYAAIPIGGTGAVGTLDVAKNKGILSVTRDGTGLYTIALGHTVSTNQNAADLYSRVLSVSGVAVSADGSAVPAIVNVALMADAVSTAGTLQVVTMSATATAANPANGATLLIRIDLSNV